MIDSLENVYLRNVLLEVCLSIMGCIWDQFVENTNECKWRTLKKVSAFSCGAELIYSCYQVIVPKLTKYLVKSAKQSKGSQTKPVSLC